MTDPTRTPDEELSREEREGYDRLAREQSPGDLLEERVVRALADQGLLRSSDRKRMHVPRSLWRSPQLLGAAAALVIFLAGLGMGHWLGARSATSALLAVREQNSYRVATQVQSAGSEYVRALTRFAELSAEGSAQEISQGQEAALGALLAAVEILARLEPDDPALEGLLGILQQRRGGGAADTTSIQQVYWF